MSDTYGEITNSKEGIKWTVPSFLHLPLKENYYVHSSTVVLYENLWVLQLYPYHSSIDGILFNVCLVRVADKYHKTRQQFASDKEYRTYKLNTARNKVEDTRKFMCRIGFLDRDGTEKYLECREDFSIGQTHFNGNKFFGCNFYKNRNYVQRFTSLTVFCCVFPIKISIEAASATASKESPNLGKLQLDLKKLLESGSETADVIIVVSDREFRAHQCILRARSPVFDAMFTLFTHDTEEKKSGRVVISDLDPGIFQDFLEYVYTGSMEKLSNENVFGLYATADKYGVQELKYEAVEYMQRSLSSDSFWDIMTLAFLHGEKDLVQRVVDYFKNNLCLVLATEKWQTLMKENGTLANELLIKAYNPVGTK